MKEKVIDFIKAIFMKKSLIRLTALCLSVVLLFFAIPDNVYAEAADAIGAIGGETDSVNASFSSVEENSNAEADDAEAQVLYEEVSLREESVKHFRLSDGSYLAAQYPIAVHKISESGELEDINNTLYAATQSFETLDERIKLSKKITGNGSLFTLNSGNAKIRLSLIGATKGVVGEVTNGSDSGETTELQKMLNLERLSSSVIYRDILDNVDLEYLINGLGVKENIIVKEKASSYSYSFELKLNGLTAELNSDGSVSLTNGDGEISYLIPAPVVYDSVGAPGSASFTLLDNGNGKYTLTVTADSAWMNSSERAYPVTIDPEISTPTTRAADLYVDRDYPSTSYGSAPTIKVGDGKTAYWATGGIGFIPVNAYVTKATLSLTSSHYSNAYVGAYQVTSSWTGALTYNQTINTQNPQGAFNENEMLSYCYVSGNGQTYKFDITDAVRYWRENPSKNYGIALKYIQGDGGAYFHSVNNTDANYAEIGCRCYHSKFLLA